MSVLPPSCGVCGNIPYLSLQRLHTPPSTLSALLQSNAIPTQSQARMVIDVITNALDDLSALDRRISFLQDIVAKLRDERQKHYHKILHYRGVVSPLRRIPPEVLSDIFMESIVEFDQDGFLDTDSCGRDGGGGIRMDSLDGNVGPWALSRVCQSWREVALAHHMLWSNVSVDLNSDRWSQIQPNKLQSRKDMLDTFLSRSKECPLNVHIQVRDGQSTNPDILLPIVLTSHRWKTAHLIDPPLRILSHVTGNLPHLLKLKIQISPTNVTNPLAHQLDMFSDVPNLREAHLNVSPLFAKTQLFWQNLTKLVYDSERHYHAYLLSQLPELEILRLRGHAKLSEPLPKFKKLHTLQIDDLHSGETLRCFTVPRLETLIFGGSPTGTTAPSTAPGSTGTGNSNNGNSNAGTRHALQQLMERSNCHPKNLVIHFSHSQLLSHADGEDINFLYSIPSITHLTLIGITYREGERIFHHMTMNEGMLPGLTKLSIQKWADNPSCDYLFVDGLAKLVSSRLSSMLPSASASGPSHGSGMSMRLYCRGRLKDGFLRKLTEEERNKVRLEFYDPAVEEAPDWA